MANGRACRRVIDWIVVVAALVNCPGFLKNGTLFLCSIQTLSHVLRFVTLCEVTLQEVTIRRSLGSWSGQCWNWYGSAAC